MNRLLLLTGFLFFAFPSFSAGNDATYGDVSGVRFIEAVGPGSILVDIPGMHPLIGKRIEVRIRGIDVPDLISKCSKERVLAEKARSITGLLLSRSKNITLRNIGRGRSFEITAIVLADGKDIRNVLVKKGLAVNVVGKFLHKDWCE